MFKQVNSKKQGDVGLGVAIAWFVTDYTVSIPLTDSQDYDLIVDKENSLYRVQVKTTSDKTEYGIYKVELRVKGGNKSGTGKIKKFDNKKVDLLFVLTDNGNKYCIPTKLINSDSTINLGDKYAEYKV